MNQFFLATKMWLREAIKKQETLDIVRKGGEVSGANKLFIEVKFDMCREGGGRG